MFFFPFFFGDDSIGLHIELRNLHVGLLPVFDLNVEYCNFVFWILL